MATHPLKIILASSSPRRRQILNDCGFDFDVCIPDEDAEDGICSGETPTEFVARLAYQKARNVAKKFDTGLFLGCDTVAEIQGQILGKPRDRTHAREMLTQLSGEEHRVFSGLCLYQRPGDEFKSNVEVTSLWMAELSESQIEDYLETGLWQGKAGAFGLQDGMDWITLVQGSESNVIGLPLELLKKMLVEF